jgi:hypothetical protein
MNRLNNINSIRTMISESFIPSVSADVSKGPSALYGWRQQTYNPSWGASVKECCPCSDANDAESNDISDFLSGNSNA